MQDVFKKARSTKNKALNEELRLNIREKTWPSEGHFATL